MEERKENNEPTSIPSKSKDIREILKDHYIDEKELNEKIKKAMEYPAEELRNKYLRTKFLPTMFCPGCGLGQIMQMLMRAIEASGIDRDKVILVSGIGCTARIPGYFDLDSIHTTHGRAIPVATAIKMTNPELTVVVVSGDGDLVGIGGNHLMHAFRRNVGIKIICATNFTYGMTGGQTAPTTPHGAISKSYPWGGNPEDNIDAAMLARVGGAPYVVRWTTYQYRNGIKSIIKALLKPGLSFIEFISPCPTNFGRLNKSGSPLLMKKWIEENTIVMKKGPDPRHHEFFIDLEDDKIQLGKFQEIYRHSFEEQWEYNKFTAKKRYFEKIREEESV